MAVPVRRPPRAAARLRFLGGWLALLVVLALAGCADFAPPSANAATSSFQAQLDRLGVPLTLPAGKAIVVNVPAFELIAFEHGNPVLRSRVIVGAPATPTPLLETTTTAVRFRPTWRPTPAMIARGEVEDRLWPPGRDNPLGLAAIRLAPGLLVYLHDTNRRDLFARPDRALSHGCIRVERWDELIAWLLDRDLAAVHALAEGWATVDVPTPPVPVRLGYFTVFPDDDGNPETFPDVYRRTQAAAEPATDGCAGTLG